MNVPFDFAIEGQVLPQGNIVSRPTEVSSRLEIGIEVSSLSPRGSGGTAKDGRSALVFDNVDGNYFLRKIVTSADNMNMEFNASKLERKTRTSEHSRNIYAENSGR